MVTPTTRRQGARLAEAFVLSLLLAVASAASPGPTSVARADGEPPDGWGVTIPPGVAPGTSVASVVVFDGALYVGTTVPAGATGGAAVLRWTGEDAPDVVIRFPTATAARLATYADTLVVGTEGDPVDVAVTTDGTAFRHVPVFSRMLGVERITPVTWGDDLLLVADTHGGVRCYGSSDGRHFWQSARSGPPSLLASVRTAPEPAARWSRGVSFDGALYVGAGNGRRAEIWRTTDTFSIDRLVPDSARRDDELIPQAVFGGHLYLVGRAAGRIDVLRTGDGDRFVRVFSAPAPARPAGALAEVGGRLVLLVGEAPAVSGSSAPISSWRSVDGIGWEPGPPIGDPGEGLGSVLVQGNALYVATTAAIGGDRVWSASTGEPWTLLAHDEGMLPAAGGARLVAFEGAVLLFHADLSEGWWVRSPPGRPAPVWPWIFSLAGLMLLLAVAALGRLGHRGPAGRRLVVHHVVRGHA